ncbi:MAG: hypothetical protein JWQ49_1229 [Edaphobacter sp.]|nr:hypothetical protein [Edaphobacter sp.]
MAHSIAWLLVSGITAHSYRCLTPVLLAQTHRIR